MRASGAPPALTVASVIALGSGRAARTASSSQALKRRSGSAPASCSERPERMYSCRSWATFIGTRFYDYAKAEAARFQGKESIQNAARRVAGFAQQRARSAFSL